MTVSMLLNCIHPPIVGSAETRFESTGVPPRLHVTRRDFASLSLPVSLFFAKGTGFRQSLTIPVLTVPPRARRKISDKTNSACAADLICGSIHPDRGPGFQGCTTARFPDPLHVVIPTCLVLSHPTEQEHKTKPGWRDPHRVPVRIALLAALLECHAKWRSLHGGAGKSEMRTRARVEADDCFLLLGLAVDIVASPVYK